MMLNFSHNFWLKIRAPLDLAEFFSLFFSFFLSLAISYSFSNDLFRSNSHYLPLYFSHRLNPARAF